MGGWTRGTLVALTVALALLGGLPSTLAIPPAPPHAASTSTSLPPLGSAAAVPRSHPPPPLTCPNGYPVYTPLPGKVYPLDPNFNFQGPCHFIAEDEIHSSFASGTNGSASRWTIPWQLPGQGAAGQQNVEDGLYVGMVVSGDPSSQWNQSYLEVQATPSVNGTGVLVWTVALAVLSFVNMTYFSPAGCPTLPPAVNLSWNDTYFCEFDDLNKDAPITLLSGVAGGTSLAVTFDGVVGARAGMDVWANETGGSSNSSFVRLNATTTTTYPFEPAYSAACAAACFLDWGLSYGLGVGVDTCPYTGLPYAVCDSYNGSAYPTLPPATWGIPEFFNATGDAYTNDYRYVQPESSSGVCNANPPVGITDASCSDYTANGGDGFYPYFSLASSGLDFGDTYASSVSTWGGPYVQFLNTPGTQDLVPLVITGIADSSLAGFVAPNLPVDVAFNVTDLGTITAASVAWSANGSAWTTDPLAGVGSVSARVYNMTIPSGPNGPVRYIVNASNAVGLSVSSSVRTVLRGPLPTFSVAVGILPGGCGTVAIGGRPYANGSVAPVGPGPIPISATGCYPYNFTNWFVSPALSVGPGGAAGAVLSVRGNGSLLADFSYVRPIDEVGITVAPSGCGTVEIDGIAYGNGAFAPVLYALPHTLSFSVNCAGYEFGGWSPGANVSVLGSTLTVLNNGSLSVTAVPLGLTSPVSFATNPASCGGVGLNGAGYTSGESVYLYSGQYNLTPEPCVHYGFQNFTTRGANLSLNGSTLTVAGNGTVTENNFHLTEVYVETLPGHCGGIVLDGVSYGNDTYVPVENHSSYTVTAFTCAGYYLHAFSPTGGLSLAGSLLTVGGSGALVVVSLPGTPSIFVGFVTSPAKCGSIDLNGTNYANGAYATLAPDLVLSIAAVPCADYGVVGWSVSGSISIVGGVVFLNGSGAITALFGAIVPILFQTVPSTCGAALVDGVPYANGASADLINGKTYSLLPAPCAHFELEDFESSPYVAILNSTIAPDGPSTITAVFQPIPYAIATTVTGPGCGTVLLDGAPVGTGDVFNLSAGNYTLIETACPTSLFEGFVVSANLSLAAGRLFVNGSGTLSATFLPIAPALTLGGNTGAFVGGTALFYAAVAVPVAANGYTYVWSFGDGSSNTTVGNTTTHIFERTGTFNVAVEVIDPFHRMANATLAVTVVAASASHYSGPLSDSLLVLGIAALLVLGVLLLARWRRPPPSSDASMAAPDPSAGDDAPRAWGDETPEPTPPPEDPTGPSAGG